MPDAATESPRGGIDGRIRPAQPTCYCIPTRPGSRFVYFESATGQKVTIEVRSTGPNQLAIGGRLPSGKEILVPAQARSASRRPVPRVLDLGHERQPRNGPDVHVRPPGLGAPMHLLTGQTLTAIPDQANPGTNNRMHVFLFYRQVRENPRPPRVAPGSRRTGRSPPPASRLRWSSRMMGWGRAWRPSTSGSFRDSA